MTDDKSPNVSTRTIRLATNAMFRLNREVRALTVSLDDLGNMNEDEYREYEYSVRLEPLPNFDERLREKTRCWECFLEREDLPRPDSQVLVQVVDDGVAEWRYVEVNDDAVLRALTGHSNDRMMSGSAYILSVVEVFSFSWWLERLCRAAGNCLTHEDENERLHMAMELGRAEREFEDFLNHHRAVELGRKTAEERSRGGASTRRPDHDQIMERMQCYIGNGKSENNAARLAFEKDRLGSSQSANRALYRSHVSKHSKKTVGR